MKINRVLNLVIGFDDMFVHSTPISREIFEQYFFVISKTHAAIFSQGLGIVAGPGIAYLMLKKVAQELDKGDEDEVWKDVQKGLINEIVRLSNVMAKGERGWQTLPLQTMLDQGKIDEDAKAEILGQLVFFTCASKVLRASLGTSMIEAAVGLWGSETTALSSTEYQNSLPTLTPGDNTGETPITSSVPQ